MKFALVALFALLPLLVSAQVPVPYTNCGAPSDHVKVYQATASVWPPTPGSSVALNIEGAVNEQVTGGSYLLSIAFDSIPIMSTQGALSDMNISFPIPAGNFTFSRSVTIPSVVPAGSLVNVNASALDANGQELICIQLAITVPSADEDEQPEIETDAAPAVAEDASQLFGEVLKEVRAIQPRTMKQVVAGLLDIVSGEMKVIADGLRREIASPEAQIPVPYTNCGQPSDIITIDSISSSVWPPQLGVSTVLEIDFTANEQIADGTYNAVVSVDGLPLINKSGDISKYFKLPILKGPVSINKTVDIPDLGIHGSIGLQLSAQDNNSNELFCLQIAFSI